MSDFHLLLEEQIPQLMRYASALTRDPEQAAELVEDTLREALSQPQDRSATADLHVRLLTILHELRDNPFRQTTAAAAAHPEALPVETLSLSRFDRALGRLPETQRAVILLIGLEGLSYDTTAAILGIPVGAMRSRLVRGRDSLRQAMGAATGTRRLARAA